MPQEQLYELVILDESESVLAQFMSSTMEVQFVAAQLAFQRLLRGCTHSLWMDAFLCDRSVLAARALVPGPLRYVHNMHNGVQRRAVCLPLAGSGAQAAEEAVVAKFLELAAAGKKCLVMSGTVALVERLEAACPAGQRCLPITGRGPDKRRKEQLRRVNEVRG